MWRPAKPRRGFSSTGYGQLARGRPRRAARWAARAGRDGRASGGTPTCPGSPRATSASGRNACAPASRMPGAASASSTGSRSVSGSTARTASRPADVGHRGAVPRVVDRRAARRPRRPRTARARGGRGRSPARGPGGCPRAARPEGADDVHALSRAGEQDVHVSHRALRVGGGRTRRAGPCTSPRSARPPGRCGRGWPGRGACSSARRRPGRSRCARTTGWRCAR